jgi:hypothetical protein
MRHPSTWIDASVLYTYVAAFMNARAWTPEGSTAEHDYTCRKLVTCILEYIHATSAPQVQDMHPRAMIKSMS